MLVILAKPQLLLVGPALGLAVAYGRRSVVPLVQALGATFVGGSLFLLYNLLRFESLTDFGGVTRTVGVRKGRGGIAVLPHDVAQLLVSPRSGFLLFSPVAVIGIALLWRHRRQPVVLACAAAALAIASFYLLLPFGGGWASRYLVPTLPLICAPLALATGRTARAAVVLVAVGFVIQLPTTVTYYEGYYSDNPGSFKCWRVADSQLWRVWGSSYRQFAAASRTDPGELLRANRLGSRDATNLKTVALWFWVLPVAGIPWQAGLVAALAMIAAGIAVLVRAARGPPVGQLTW